MNEWIVRFDTEQGEDVAVGELIRYKDCKHWVKSPPDIIDFDIRNNCCRTKRVCYWGSFVRNDDDFCSWAERKEE